MLIARVNRNTSYKDFKQSEKIDSPDKDNKKNYFKYCKNMYEDLYERKIMEYFETKGINDFKNNKLCWEFYSVFIKVKSDKSSSKQIPTNLSYNNINYAGYDQIVEAFNLFFIQLKFNNQNINLFFSNN